MPARKRQQTYRRRPRRATATEARPTMDGAHDRAAQELAANRSVAELESMVAAAREACDNADREAQEQPSPAALRRYRSASSALEEVQQALGLANHAAGA